VQGKLVGCMVWRNKRDVRQPQHVNTPWEPRLAGMRVVCVGGSSGHHSVARAKPAGEASATRSGLWRLVVTIRQGQIALPGSVRFALA
jgi:hypothetical protein